jgi:general nucleoside transport system permease protein
MTVENNRMISVKTRINIISISLSIFATLFIVSILLLIIGKDPFEVFRTIYSDVFSSGYGIGQTLFKTTPLIICGCGLAICFHANLFNIGAEGQINAGSFVIAIVAGSLSGLPLLIVLPLSMVCGFIVSGFFGFIPAVIKIKKGVSEVITTIMLNFVILALVNFFLLEFFAVESTMRTIKLPDALMIPKLSEYIPAFQGSAVNLSFLFALILSVLIYLLIYKTHFGYKLRASGLNESASEYIGLNVKKIVMTAFITGAGITAFVGVNYVFGYKGFYEFGFSANLGFTAIAVALLAKNNPIGVIFSALLFGILDHGGLSVNQIVPKEIMLVVQGLIILAILSIDRIVHNHFEKKGALFS